MTIPAMPVGEFYACDDPETLNYTDPWEAAEQYIDNMLDSTMTAEEVEAAIRNLELTVTGYVLTGVTDAEGKTWADHLLDSLVEHFDAEHGSPDDPTDPGEGAPAIMLEAVTKIVKAMHCWSCKETGSVTLDEDQAVEWARRERPDWFEVSP
jgi:hypothetical protein